MGFRSSFTKEEMPERAINPDLTEKARDKIFRIIHTEFSDGELEAVYREACQREKFEEFLENSFTERSNRYKFIHNQDTKIVLAYLEHLMEANSYITWNVKSKVIRTAEKLSDLLETEGILWEMNPDKDGHIRFRSVSSEEMAESTNEVRNLALGEEWNEELEPYLTALNTYADGTYTYHILEQLNLAIEKVVKEICIRNNWAEDENSSSGKYIAIMKEEGFFEQNNIMEEELNHLLNFMDIMRKKIEGDRKRHEDIGRNYATLVLHQASAYIYFLVRNFEDNY